MLLIRAAPLAEGEGHETTAIPAVSEVLASLASDVESTDRIPTAPQRAVYADYEPRLTRSLDQWHAIRDGDLAVLNAKLTAAGQAAIHVPTLEEIRFWQQLGQPLSWNQLTPGRVDFLQAP